MEKEMKWDLSYKLIKWEDVIDSFSGMVDVSQLESRFSFEFVEQLYFKIKPLLKERKKRDLIEGEMDWGTSHARR